MNLRILLWNVALKNLAKSVSILCERLQPTICVLLEVPPGTWSIADEPTANHYEKRSFGKNFRVISTEPARNFAEQFVDHLGRMSVLRFDLRGAPSILVSVVHLPSKLHGSDYGRTGFAREIARNIEQAEADIGHSRTLLLGDLNMNPYEPGVVGAWELNATLTRAQASLATRTVHGHERPYFYNPMWGLLGDRTPGPPGTYYTSSPSLELPHWQTLDQVLLRPSLIDCRHDVSIVHDLPDIPLLDAKGRPNATQLSDHLPLLLDLDYC